jgi:hypothetical protein
MCCISDVAQQVIKYRYSRSWLQNLPGEIDIIPTQIWFQHVSGRNLVLKLLILNVRLGKPLNWGTLSYISLSILL